MLETCKGTKETMDSWRQHCRLHGEDQFEANTKITYFRPESTSRRKCGQTMLLDNRSYQADSNMADTAPRFVLGDLVVQPGISPVDVPHTSISFR